MPQQHPNKDGSPADGPYTGCDYQQVLQAPHLVGKYIPGSKSLPQHHRVKHYKSISQSRWFFRSSRSSYLNKLVGSLVG